MYSAKKSGPMAESSSVDLWYRTLRKLGSIGTFGSSSADIILIKRYVQESNHSQHASVKSGFKPRETTREVGLLADCSVGSGLHRFPPWFKV